MSAEIDPIFNVDRHEHTRDEEFRCLASEVIRHAFHELAEAERWVAAHCDQIRRLPRPMYRGPRWRSFGLELDKRLQHIDEDRVWTMGPNWDLWMYWLDVDADVLASEYQRRAKRLLDRVAEIRGYA